MSIPNEPFSLPNSDPWAVATTREHGDRSARIKRLIHSQSFAVLCTQGEGQPYGSLVAYTTDEQLRCLAFATSRATRKFRLLSQCDHVALLIDNRPQFPDELMKVEAVTATGRASLLEPGEERDRWTQRLTERHPYLSHFVRSSSCGLFRVEILRYLHVCRFQEVSQWIPDTAG